MNEQELHEYTKYLMEVWNPNQLYIPFAVDAPKAYLRHKAEQLNLLLVSNTVCEYCGGWDYTEEGAIAVSCVCQDGKQTDY